MDKKNNKDLKNKPKRQRQRKKRLNEKKLEGRTRSAVQYMNKRASQAMQEVAGGQGKDARDPDLVVAKNGVNSQVMKTQMSDIIVKAYVDPNAIWFLALGPVSLAIQKGWLSSNQGGTFGGSGAAYHALVFLVEAFYSAMKGTFPTNQSAARWFWEVCHALLPKTVKFKTGTISFSWGFNSSDPPQKIPYGAGKAYFLGYPNGFTTNGFPELTMAAPYTPELGAEAISSLFRYFNGKDMAYNGPLPEKLFLQDDVSAFASVYPEWGSSITGSGGIATTIQSEVKVTCPLLAKFAQYQGSSSEWRGFQEARKGAGTAMYIIPRMLEMTSINELRNKCSPVFKFYNFDEYFLTLSYILCLASEQLYRDNANASVPTCPLTSWQVQIILRQALLPRFYNQYAQDLLSQGEGPTLVPFCVGANGSSVSITQGMKLPFVFIENVRCAARRTVDVGGAKGSYIFDAVPILCRPADIPRLDNFTFNQPNGDPVTLYNIQPGEVPIDLIDLSFNNGTEYITATGAALTELVTLWNEYITKLGNALTTLGTIGTESGISALITTFTTRHVYNNPVNFAPTNAQVSPIMTKQASAKKIVARGSIIPKKTGVGAPTPVPGQSDHYVNYSAYRITSNSPFYSSLWRYSGAFVQPCMIGETVPEDSSTIPFQQVFQVEPYSMPYADLNVAFSGTWGNAVNLNAIALASASLDIKSNLASPPEVEIELATMARTGRGGFFTSLAGAIGEGLGIPGAKELAHSIGAMTGL